MCIINNDRDVTVLILTLSPVSGLHGQYCRTLPHPIGIPAHQFNEIRRASISQHHDVITKAVSS